ncbi:hypothetical protein LINGRAHAP2_LOCUS33013 [Linum grandiflorum]
MQKTALFLSSAVSVFVTATVLLSLPLWMVSSFILTLLRKQQRTEDSSRNDDDDDDKLDVQLPKLPFAPHAHPERKPWLRDYCGVGLDLVANVVKVVVVHKYKLTSSPVYVYTLPLCGGGGRVWKLAGEYPYAEDTKVTFATSFKGSIYWNCYVGDGHIPSYTVTFDLGTQVFRKVICPSFDPPPLLSYDYRLHIYRDSIAIFQTKPHNPGWSVDVWTLTSSQEEELCWIKDSSSSIIGPFLRGLLVHICWNDHLLLAQPVREDPDIGLACDTVDLVAYI